jgi:hypothetical protein
MQSALGPITPSRGLHRLIYASRQRVAAGQSAEEEIADLIRASIRNNRAVSVTGLLLVHDGWFVQALEGPAQAVAATYDRICNDARHTHCKVLAAGLAEAREFGDWNMCARSFSAADDEILDTLGQRQAFEPGRLDGRGALRLLKAVRGIQDRVARGG